MNDQEEGDESMGACCLRREARCERETRRTQTKGSVPLACHSLLLVYVGVAMLWVGPGELLNGCKGAGRNRIESCDDEI